jgi:hypothetical protein
MDFGNFFLTEGLHSKFVSFIDQKHSPSSIAEVEDPSADTSLSMISQVFNTSFFF